MLAPAARTVFKAQEVAQTLPPLLVEALNIAQVLNPGQHNHNKAGLGNQFYEYAPYKAGMPTKEIDWRASARSEHTYTRTTEKETTQKNVFWVEHSPLMAWHSNKKLPLKEERAALLALIFAISLLKAQETITPYGRQKNHTSLEGLLQFFEHIQKPHPLSTANVPLPKHTHVFMFGAFSINPEPIQQWLSQHPHITPIIVDVIDPHEATFPYKGPTLFTSFFKGPAITTGAAQQLRKQYFSAFQKNQENLQKTIQSMHGLYAPHITNTAPHNTVLNTILKLRQGV